MIFGFAVFTGSYIQSVIGFAMGMIIMAIVGASAAVPIPVLTAAISIVSFVNCVVALRGHTSAIDWRILRWLMIGQLPAIFVGIYLLGALNEHLRWVLQLLLGLFITLGSLSMMLRPSSRLELSPPWACVSAGIGGGLIGGLFSASGPVIGWFTYRQPLPLAAIRATMLCFFAAATSARTLFVWAQGDLTAEVAQLALLAAPLVIIGAWLGQRLPPPMSEVKLKRSVFYLLFALGLMIIAGAVHLSQAGV